MYTSPDIFVDLSYVSYFSIFASWKWYKNEFIYDDTDYRLAGDFDPMTDPEYEKYLERKLSSTLFGCLTTVVPIIDRSRVFYAIDCSKKDIWRNHFYPTYKMHRYNKPLGFNIKESFNYILKEYIPIICEKYGSHMLSSDNAEADDIIGHIILEKAKHNDTNNLVIASDRDLTQLCPYTKIYDLYKTELTIETSYVADKTIEMIEDTEDVGTFLLYKALKGDNSDKINGFRPRTGPKTAAKFINNREELKDVCNNNVQCFKNLKTNLKIMDLTRIPETIKTNIWNLWEEVNDNSEQQNDIL